MDPTGPAYTECQPRGSQTTLRLPRGPGGRWAVSVNKPDPGTALLMRACLLSQDLPATNPKLDTPDLLEVGTQQKLVCSLEGLFPASEAQMYLELGGGRLTQESTNGRDFVSVTALLNVTEEFDRTLPLRCVLKLADQILETQRTLTIYSKKGRGLVQR